MSSYHYERKDFVHLKTQIPFEAFRVDKYHYFQAMSIGSEVRKYRKGAGLSQADLAEKTMLSLRTIQRIENDKNTPRGYTIKAIAQALDIAPEQLAESKSADDRVLQKLELINLSVLSFIIIPFGNLIFPIMIWRKYSYRELVDQVGRRIINFQITWSLITYTLLSISPFLNGLFDTSFPIIFTVLIAAYIINISAVLETTKRLKVGDYDIDKRSFKFL